MIESRTSLNRRRLLQRVAAGATLLSASTLPWSVRAVESSTSVTPLKGGLFLLSGAGGNIVVFDNGSELLLVDSGSPAAQNPLQRTLQEAFGGRRVTTLFNTHWHQDQTGGNAAFGGAGANIIAHERTRLRLATEIYWPFESRYQKPLPTAGLPTRTVLTADTLHAGDESIDFGYLVEAHTDGDIFVHFKSTNVIVVGDAVASPAADPVFDWYGGGWLGGRLDSQATLLEMADDDTLFVPAYGAAITRAEVQKEFDVLSELFERMIELIRKGYGAELMRDAGILDGLDRTFHDPDKLLYDAHKGLWAHHNKLRPDIV
ncbi:MAG: MBL fold metallo-hydrolase [Gammaproteobacteria bacterium]|nr:MBL fold metallo-hydrolase [Gammaproteobacteria bacterium]